MEDLNRHNRPPPSEDTTTRRLPAGLTDAAFASLATFGAGLAAVTLMSDVNRGVYALFFAAFSLGVVLPWNLVLIPAEINAVARDLPDRLRSTTKTLRMGIAMSILGSLVCLVAAYLARDLTDPEVVWMLAITATITTILSPLQDHMRRLLHISEQSWRAAIVSIVQFVTVVATFGILWVVDAPLALIPFGSLAAANAVSLTAALVLGRVFAQAPMPGAAGFWDLVREGKWLLAQTIVPSLARFAGAAIVTAVAGAVVLGYVEAARVVAQPVLVFATGLTAVLAPKAMRASMDIDIEAARHTRRIFLVLVGGVGLVYLLWASTDWWGNPMAYIVPAAYVVSGLVAVTILANMATSALYLDTNELLGARMARQLSVVSMLLSPLIVIFAFTSAAIGAFAIPLGRLVRTTINSIWFRFMLRKHYAAPGYLRAKPDRESVDTAP